MAARGLADRSTIAVVAAAPAPKGPEIPVGGIRQRVVFSCSQPTGDKRGDVVFSNPSIVATPVRTASAPAPAG